MCRGGKPSLFQAPISITSCSAWSIIGEDINCALLPKIDRSTGVDNASSDKKRATTVHKSFQFSGCVET